MTKEELVKLIDTKIRTVHGRIAYKWFTLSTDKKLEIVSGVLEAFEKYGFLDTVAIATTNLAQPTRLPQTALLVKRDNDGFKDDFKVEVKKTRAIYPVCFVI